MKFWLSLPIVGVRISFPVQLEIRSVAQIIFLLIAVGILGMSIGGLLIVLGLV